MLSLAKRRAFAIPVWTLAKKVVLGSAHGSGEDWVTDGLDERIADAKIKRGRVHIVQPDRGSEKPSA